LQKTFLNEIFVFRNENMIVFKNQKENRFLLVKTSDIFEKFGKKTQPPFFGHKDPLFSACWEKIEDEKRN